MSEWSKRQYLRPTSNANFCQEVKCVLSSCWCAVKLVLLCFCDEQISCHGFQPIRRLQVERWKNSPGWFRGDPQVVCMCVLVCVHARIYVRCTSSDKNHSASSRIWACLKLPVDHGPVGTMFEFPLFFVGEFVLQHNFMHLGKNPRIGLRPSVSGAVSTNGCNIWEAGLASLAISVCALPQRTSTKRELWRADVMLRCLYEHTCKKTTKHTFVSKSWHHHSLQYRVKQNRRARMK